MPMDHSEVLKILKDNEVNFDRWFTIDDLIYICFVSTDHIKSEENKVKKLFIETDTFMLYKNICIDMSKQPGEKKETEEEYRERKSRTKIKFEL